MKRKRILRLVACVLALAGWALAGDPKGSAKIDFVVLKEATGKPVRNAAVILHSVDKDGRQGRGGLELKTNDEGKTTIEGIPYGKLRVQVIARGLQTYGEDFTIDQTTHTITIKLKQPQGQYSIYK